VDDLQNQVSTLRSRLAVYEARAVPYSAEELALFKAPEPGLAKADPRAGRTLIKGMPAGTATLVADAQRLFQTKQYDQAEEKYLQILRQGEENAYTLANLAAIQIELGHFDEAENHVKKALTGAPDDAYSLSILGYLRFKQERYDEAENALSRSARLNPQSAEVQNYLGVTLSHKGLRIPAETALRKAIQLDPNYGSAHNNLAVIYATQQPPMINLARWHYERALAAGHPHNPELERLFEQKGAPVSAP
jgi:tetratricopeptide (TPR) repeat protein